MSVVLSKSLGLISFTSVDPSAKEFVYQILRRETEDGNEYLFYDDQDRFPAGLINYVCNSLEKVGWGYTLVNIDPLQPPPEIDPHLLSTPEGSHTLYEHQIDAVRKILCIKTCLIEAPPGAGKTEIWCCVLKMLDLPSLTILAQLKHAKNMYDRMKKRGIKDVGYIAEGEIQEIGRHYVASSDTVYNALKSDDSDIVNIVKDSEILCFDESHRLANSFSWHCIANVSKAKYRVGLSAYQFANPDDPYSNIGDMHMIALTGELVLKIPARFLISKGLVCEPLIYRITVRSPYVHIPYDKEVQWQDRIDKKGERQLGVYSKAIVLHERRNDIITRLAYNLSKSLNNRIMINFFRIEHGRSFIRTLGKAGVRCFLNSGGGNIEMFDFQEVLPIQMKEDELIKKFTDGEFQVLAGSTIFDESVDIPCLTDIIMAAGMRTSRRQKQRVGRTMRLNDNKEDLVLPGEMHSRVWDFQDNQCWVTKHQSTARFKSYEEEDYQITDIIPDEFLMPIP